MYLWLNSEGWIRFGPFDFLSFDENPRVIRDGDGTVVAKYDQGDWRVASEEYAKWQFRNPVITSSPYGIDKRNGRPTPSRKTPLSENRQSKDALIQPSKKFPLPENRQSENTLIQPSFFELDPSETEPENLD